jgi:hypothetical protein
VVRGLFWTRDFKQLKGGMETAFMGWPYVSY